MVQDEGEEIPVKWRVGAQDLEAAKCVHSAGIDFELRNEDIGGFVRGCFQAAARAGIWCIIFMLPIEHRAPAHFCISGLQILASLGALWLWVVDYCRIS